MAGFAIPGFFVGRRVPSWLLPGTVTGPAGFINSGDIASGFKVNAGMRSQITYVVAGNAIRAAVPALLQQRNMHIYGNPSGQERIIFPQPACIIS